MRSRQQQDKRALGDLWLVVGIAASMAAYHLGSWLCTALPERFAPALFYLQNFLFFWIFSLLLIAYRRWRLATALQNDLRNIMRSITTEVIMVVGQDRRIEHCNEALTNIFGHDVGDVIGQTTDMLYDDRRNDKNSPEIRAAIERCGIHIGTAVGKRKNGDAFPLEIVTALLKGRKGAVLLIKDTTEPLRQAAAVVEAKKSAEAATEAKARVLAELQVNYSKLKELEKLRDNLTHMVVHDMRTPLHVIQGNVESLRARSLAWYRMEQGPLDEVLAQTQRLAVMVNDLLDVGRLESGKFPLRKSQHDLHATVREALCSLGPLANRVRVETEFADTPLLVECDANVVRRIAVNLLVNAIKYTPPGGLIRVQAAGFDRSARVTVIDAGPGIPPERHLRIFEKFGQAEASSSRKDLPSSGLGLTFCKLAVEAHGGSIGLESAIGSGAAFWFDLPLQAPANPPHNVVRLRPEQGGSAPG